MRVYPVERSCADSSERNARNTANDNSLFTAMLRHVEARKEEKREGKRLREKRTFAEGARPEAGMKRRSVARDQEGKVEQRVLVKHKKLVIFGAQSTRSFHESRFPLFQ